MSKFSVSYSREKGEQDFVRASALRVEVGRHLSARDRQACIYFSRLLDLCTKDVYNIPSVTILFRNDGTLLSLYGAPQVLSHLRNNGIRLEMVWSIAQMGQNAITRGLQDNQSYSSVGSENQAAFLQGYAIHYAPVKLMSHTPPFEEETLYGVAMLIPVGEKHPEAKMLLQEIAHDLVLNIHFRETTDALYERNNVGMLHIDLLMDPAKIMITHCNNTLFKLFDMPSQSASDYAYTPLELLIDPLPQNRRFWELLETQSVIENLPITLSVQDRLIPCILSADYYFQPALQVKAIAFSVTSNSHIASTISKKISNSAIISFDSIVGQSPKFLCAVEKGRQIAQTDSNVLLLGESGSGKDVFAQAIHNQSSRYKKPFVAINCAALPRDLIASELFGYDGGAFTGAKRQGNIGKFELANGGTIFLDEIGDLPLDLQSTLLRVVEQKQFCRLGSNQPIKVDVKIISATNADLMKMIEQKHFRADLYYRLSTMQLSIPPLRERGEDAIALAEHFIEKISDRIGRSDIMQLSPEAKKLLLDLSWPGNVRELQNLIECIVQLYPQRLIQTPYILDNINRNNLLRSDSGYAAASPSAESNKSIRHITLTREELLQILDYYGNNKSAAARHLGISLRTLYRKMEQLGL